MAAGNVSHGNGITKFILPGSQFSYDRLAEDVFYYLYDLFKVEKRLIPLPRFAENSYSHPFAIRYIARQSQLDQIVYRSIWYDVFIKNDTALQTKNDITKLYELVNDNVHRFRDEFIEVYKKCTPDVLFHISFAFIVELTLFMIMKKNKSVIKKMARVWVTFFTNDLKEAFEAYGGLSRILQKTSGTNVMDTLMFDFIRTRCVPYTGQSVHDTFLEALDEEVKEKKIAKMINKEVEELRNLVELGFPSVSPEPEKDQSELNPSPGLEVHERLEIVPHEVIIQKYVDVTLPQPKQTAAPAKRLDLKAKGLALQAERRKAMKRPKEGSSSSMAKEHLQYHKEKEPAANIDALSIETTDELTAKATAALSLKAENRKSKELPEERSSSSMAKVHLKNRKDKEPAAKIDTSSVDTTDESTAKAIAALSLQAESRKAKELLTESSSSSMVKVQLQHQKEKEPAANVDASSVETSDESTAKAIAALSLKAERKRTRKLLKERNSFSIAKALWQLLHKEKEPTANVGPSGVKITEKPEARVCDRVPPIHHEQYHGDLADPESPTTSDAIEIDYSLQGARPKTRKS